MMCSALLIGCGGQASTTSKESPSPKSRAAAKTQVVEPEQPPAQPTPPPAEPTATELDEEPPNKDVGDTVPDPETWDEIELTPTKKAGCARMHAPREGRLLCQTIQATGAELDEMTREERGRFTVRDGKTITETFEYDRVLSEGAAGSVYETYFAGVQPQLVLHRCLSDREPFDPDEPHELCGVRFAPSPGR